MDVRMPDGTIIKNVPDGTTKEELTRKLARRAYRQAQGKSNISPDVSGADAFLIGAGKTFSDLYSGGKELIGKMTGTADPEAFKQRRENEREIFGALQEKRPVASFAGQVAPYMITAPLVGPGALAQAGAGAGIAGIESGGDIGSALTGGALGAGGAMAGQAIGRGVNALAGRYGREAGEGMLQTAGRGRFAPAEAFLSRSPMGARPVEAINRANQTTLKRMALEMIGETTDVDAALQGGLGSRNAWNEVVRRANSRIGGMFDRSLQDATVTIDAGTRTVLEDLPGGSVARILRTMPDTGEITGREAHSLIQALRRLTKNADAEVRHEAYGAMRNVFDRIGQSNADQELFRVAREQYRNLLALSRGKVITKSGNISPEALQGNISKIYGQTKRVTNRAADQAQRAALRMSEVADTIPNSGTPTATLPILLGGLGGAAMGPAGILAAFAPGIANNLIQAAPAPMAAQFGGALARGMYP